MNYTAISTLPEDRIHQKSQTRLCHLICHYRGDLIVVGGVHKPAKRIVKMFILNLPWVTSCKDHLRYGASLTNAVEKTVSLPEDA